MTISTCSLSQIKLLVLVLFLLCTVQAESGNNSNRTWLIGLDQNATDGSGTNVPWVRRVRKQAIGCDDKPWICNQGGFPFQVRKRCCNNRCVEVTSDVNNCGVCGIRCLYNWQCCRGICVDTSYNWWNCGKCFNRCPLGVFCTYGMCGYAGGQPFPPFPPRPFPPRPPKPFPPRPPKPPTPFPPKPPKPPRGPEQPEPPQSQPFPVVGQPPLIDAPPLPPQSQPFPVIGQPPLIDAPSPPQSQPLPVVGQTPLTDVPSPGESPLSDGQTPSTTSEPHTSI